MITTTDPGVGTGDDAGAASAPVWPIAGNGLCAVCRPSCLARRRCSRARCMRQLCKFWPARVGARPVGLLGWVLHLVCLLRRLSVARLSVARANTKRSRHECTAHTGGKAQRAHAPPPPSQPRQPQPQGCVRRARSAHPRRHPPCRPALAMPSCR
eukprot:364843-Chlamydomonas_euryale.AAC.6